MFEIEAEKNFDLLKKTIKELCAIPAPSHYEDERAEYCLNFVKERGFDNAYIDEAKNCIWTIKGESDRLIVFSSHTDTVFPDRTPMPFIDDGEFFRCPGVGDDTGCLVPLLIASCDFLKMGIKPKNTIMFVANSCEEGLGNLKGVREICKNFGDKIDAVIPFDGRIQSVCSKAVGSHRYKVTIQTKGGHSFSKFGNTNAIAIISEIVNEIYQIEVPKTQDSITTYNVGIINGGTSVNTIAQEVSMLCEYRSNDKECLKIMQDKFNAIFTKQRKDAVVLFELIGERPCASEVNKEKQEKIINILKTIQGEYAGVEIKDHAGSTDCNIPLSMGINAVCAGAFDGEGAHTREEWIRKDGLKKGYQICLNSFIEFAKKGI